MKRILYLIFGHKWVYYYSSINQINCRYCKYTGILQQYIALPYLNGVKTCWVNLNERTKLGAKGFLDKTFST